MTQNMTDLFGTLCATNVFFNLYDRQHQIVVDVGSTGILSSRTFEYLG
jgi:hypothetical protein